MNTSSPKKQYFDLHTAGLAYLHRIREVGTSGNGRKAKPYLACTLKALYGPADNYVPCFIDTVVSGEKAKTLVRQYLGANDPGKLPMVRFHAGDLSLKAFTRTRGDDAGEPGWSLKGRLLTAELVEPTELANIEFYDLITRGIGHLRRQREVTTDDGEQALAFTLVAISGPIAEPDYQPITVTVKGDEAEDLAYRWCLQAVEARRKVFVSFRLNGLAIRQFVHSSGDDAGQLDATIDADLVHFGMVKVDGTTVYKAPPPASTDAQAETIAESQDEAADDGSSDEAAVDGNAPTSATGISSDAMPRDGEATDAATSNSTTAEAA